MIILIIIMAMIMKIIVMMIFDNDNVNNNDSVDKSDNDNILFNPRMLHKDMFTCVQHKLKGNINKLLVKFTLYS